MNAAMSLPAADILTRTFGIILDRKHAVESALVALAKRAARKQIPGVLSWTWGKAYPCETRVPNHDGFPPDPGARLSASGDTWVIPITRVPLILTGETPRLNGWRFVATLQHLDGENIVRVLPGQEISPAYRTRGSVCDHCRANRRRNDTYVLRHDDGRTMQVGSSCIRDFLGGDDAADIAARAEIIALGASVAGDGEEGFGRIGGHGETLLSEYLPIVSWVVRVEGWVSRTVARERDRPETATADRAWFLMTNGNERRKAGCEPTSEDTSDAFAAETWAESLTDEAVEASSSDYLHNLRAIARTGLASFRTAGIAASMVTAHQREIGKARQRAERAARPTLNAHVGEVGARVTFGLPAKTGKKGQPLKGAPCVLRTEPVTLDFVTGYETEFGYTTVLKFRTNDGATLVWKASSTEIGRDDVGRRFTIAGTVKKHDEYKGEKQTLLSRCDVRAIEEKEGSAS